MEITSVNSIQIITAESSIHTIEAEMLEKKLQAAFERGNNRFIIDLTNVMHICSSALGTIVSYKREFSKKQGDLRLVMNSDYLSQLFEITMLDKVFDIYHTVSEALASFEN